MARVKRDPSQTRQVFGERLRSRRKEMKLTLEDVAEKAQMNWSYIAQVERGERNVSIDNMTALAEALDVPLRDLL